MRNLDGQSGSALVEAAILFPVLILILYWSIALTEVLILKLKASEAARFALWETTVWKSPSQIDREVRQRFADLRSAAGIDRAATALLLFPRSAGLRWGADVDVASGEVMLSGDRVRFSGGPGILGSFLGMRRQPWFPSLDSVTARIQAGGVARALLGGTLPRIFSTGRMDSPERGPITILPQGTQRAGDVVSRTTKRLTGLDAYTDREDVTRNTVPHGINSQYWRASGGPGDGSIRSLSPLPARLATANQYVEAWSCRGPFFAGSTVAQEHDSRRRYRPPCR